MSAAFLNMQKYLAQANTERATEAPKVVIKRRRAAPLVTVKGAPKCVKKSTPVSISWSAEELQKMASNMVEKMRAPTPSAECIKQERANSTSSFALAMMQNINRELKLVEY